MRRGFGHALVVASAMILSTLPAVAAALQVDRGDCSDGLAVAVSVACGDADRAPRRTAQCAAGCCEPSTLRRRALAQCPEASTQARAQNFNSSRSNRRNVAPPDDDADAHAGQSDSRGRAGRDGRDAGRGGRHGRNPQTGKEIKIPEKGDEDDDSGG